MVCQVPTGGAGRGLDHWGAAETKLMGASARLRLVRLLGQDLPPLIVQPKEQIRLGMGSEFVGEFTEPCPVFWRGPGPASAEFKGAWALEDVSLWWVGMSSPALPTFLPALPAFSIRELWAREPGLLFVQLQHRWGLR